MKQSNPKVDAFCFVLASVWLATGASNVSVRRREKQCEVKRPLPNRFASTGISTKLINEPDNAAASIPLVQENELLSQALYMKICKVSYH